MPGDWAFTDMVSCTPDMQHVPVMPVPFLHTPAAVRPMPGNSSVVKVLRNAAVFTKDRKRLKMLPQ